MFHLNLDTMIEALNVLQKERGYVEASLMMYAPEATRQAQTRANRINKACQELTDRLVDAVEEMP